MLDILILFVYGFLHLPAEETDFASSNISIISSRSCSTVFMPLLRPQLTRLAFPWAMLSATQNFMSCCQIKSTVMAGLPFRDHLLVCNFHFPPTPHSIAHSYSDSPGTYTCTSTTETQIAYVLACLLLLGAEKLYHCCASFSILLVNKWLLSFAESLQVFFATHAN